MNHFLEKEEVDSVKYVINSIDVDSEVYLVGSATSTEDYSDIDIAVVTGDMEPAKDSLEALNSVERSFGSIEDSSLDRWNVQATVDSAELDITVHKPPYNTDFYESDHVKINELLD
jgi:predicted nucleotidyltransferase